MGNMYEIRTASRVQQPPASPLEHLTRRQHEVLALLCEGLPNKLIGRRLNIAGGTVKVHVANIMHALNVSSRLQVVIAVRSLEIDLNSGGAQPMSRATVSAPCYPLLQRRPLMDGDTLRLRMAVTDRWLAAAN